MSYPVKLTDLVDMTQAEQAKVLTELTDSAQQTRNGQTAVMDARIRVFERRYKMTSTELLKRLKGGELAETADISRWLFWLEARVGKMDG